MKSTNKRMDLDWSRLMGFSQVKSAKGKTQRGSAISGKLGAKVGGKPPPAD